MMSADGAKGSTLFFGGGSERSSYCAYARMIVNGMMQPAFSGNSVKGAGPARPPM
jgi:hypothetical protein